MKFKRIHFKTSALNTFDPANTYRSPSRSFPIGVLSIMLQKISKLDDELILEYVAPNVTPLRWSVISCASKKICFPTCSRKNRRIYLSTAPSISRNQFVAKIGPAPLGSFFNDGLPPQPLTQINTPSSSESMTLKRKACPPFPKCSTC